MTRKRKKYRVEKPAGGFDHVTSSTEFYSSGPVEQPLSGDRAPSDSQAVRRTKRHQAVSSRGKDKIDPREKMALIAILKLFILLATLMITFFLLWKGINLYEESIWIDTADIQARSPVLEEMELVEEFDIADRESREQFAARIEQWKEAERLVASADLLLQRKIYDQAILQCQEAIRRDPAHMGALERLGRLYYAQGSYVEAVNAYIRLLSVDPARKETQVSLIEALDAYGDDRAVKYMAEWYLEKNPYDAGVQRYLARALFALEEFEASAEAYRRALREAPGDVESLEQQAAAYMQIEQFDLALKPLEKLREMNYRNPPYYRQMAVCHAQLEQPQECVEMLLRATQLFGQQVVLAWLQDPMLDPVREERPFQAFVDRVGGKDFRLGIEEMARRAAEKGAQEEKVEPQLEMPDLQE
jgi:tetratricopeptide (TPR) repeat protein